MNTPENFLNQDNNSFDIVKEIRYYLFFWPGRLSTGCSYAAAATTRATDHVPLITP